MRARGFTLPEVLLGVLLLSISIFGYVALHERLIYSNWRIAERQIPREEARQELTGLILQMRLYGNVSAPNAPGFDSGLKHLVVEKKPLQVRNETIVDEYPHVDTYEFQRREGW